MSALPATPLTLTRRLDGPWLGVRHGTCAELAELVLAGDERCPNMWRRVDAEQPVMVGFVESTRLTPLSEFGVACSLYPHSRVLSVYRIGISRAKRYGHTAGGHWPWEGARVDRIKFPRGMVDALKAAVHDCNAHSKPCTFSDDVHDLTIGSARGG